MTSLHTRIFGPARLFSLLFFLSLSLAWSGATSAADTRLAKALERGTLTVAIYNDLAPFHADGKGIDVDLARALADELGLRAQFLPFDADEELGDDLRNMVWKGHYLGFGPADVMIHVPFDQRLMQAEDLVTFFAPYLRETVALAYDPNKIDASESLLPFESAGIAVDGTSIGALIMVGADGGRYKDNVKVFTSVGQAIQAFRAGEVEAVMALDSELQAGLAGTDFPVVPVPHTMAPKSGWVVGLAVRHTEPELARKLQAAMNSLRDSGKLDALFKAHKVKRQAP